VGRFIDNCCNLSNQLTTLLLQVNGKSTFKEEFVSWRNRLEREINLKPWKANCMKTSILLGEIVNIDAITGDLISKCMDKWLILLMLFKT
jgi:predicted flavoprotein YhiN